MWTHWSGISRCIWRQNSGYSPLTARTYSHDLRQFCAFLEARETAPDPALVTTPLIREWVISMHHRGLVSNTIARHLYAARSGLDPRRATLYTLRHSMATLLLRTGRCSLVEIQHILGHARRETTAVYLHVGGRGLRRAAAEAHPMA